MRRNNAAAALRQGRLGVTVQGCFDIKHQDVQVEGVLQANIKIFALNHTKSFNSAPIWVSAAKNRLV